MSNALITLVVFTVIIVGFLAWAGRPPSAGGLFLFVGYASALVLIATGFSLAASVLFLRYRDLNQVWDLIIQVGFFVAPIIYPIAILPERYHFYLYLWAPTPATQFARSVLVEGRILSAGSPSEIAGAYLGLLTTPEPKSGAASLQ